MKVETKLHIDIDWNKVNIVVDDYNLIVITDPSYHDRLFAGTVVQNPSNPSQQGKYYTDFDKDSFRLFAGELILSND